MNKKYTIEEVKKVFEENKCELLETRYINANSLMRYRCACGNISKICFNHFKQGNRCKKCGYKRIGDKLKLTYDYVSSFFEKNNCKLLSNEYINNSTLMEYRCSCGNISETRFNDFKRGQRCNKCGIKRGAEKIKKSLESVKNYFEKYNYELLENKYKNSITLMIYKCPNGHIEKTTFGNFLKGKRCRQCWIDYNRGKNHFNYDPNITDEERKTQRNYPEYYDWRDTVFKRDDYICQKCDERGGYLNAHHIEGYAENKGLRIDKNNGVTWCSSCHKKFHNKYGRGKNTKQQYNKFLKIGVKNV